MMKEQKKLSQILLEKEEMIKNKDEEIKRLREELAEAKKEENIFGSPLKSRIDVETPESSEIDSPDNR